MRPSSEKTKQLNRFTACFAFVMNVDFNHIRGFADRDVKMLCIYAAMKELDVNVWELSNYYRLPKLFIFEQMRHIAVQTLVNDDLRNAIDDVLLFWNLLTVSKE